MLSYTPHFIVLPLYFRCFFVTLSLSLIHTYIHTFIQGMRLLPDYEGVVYRGYPDKATTLQQYKLGRPIQWGAFTSTSTDFEATKGFTNRDTGVIFKITVSSGKVRRLCVLCLPLVLVLVLALVLAYASHLLLSEHAFDCCYRCVHVFIYIY